MPSMSSGSATVSPGRCLRVCVIGSGTRFLSGISYYTNRLVVELGGSHEVSAILMRALLPARLYPGRERVGKTLVDFRYPRGAQVFDGVDWFWGRSMLRALRFLARRRPQIVVLQWWTGTVLHSYLALAIAARLAGATVVTEYHEVLDTAELRIAPVRWYVEHLAPLLVRLTAGSIVHNEFDRLVLERHYPRLRDKPTAVIPLGPFDQYASGSAPGRADHGTCHLLFFGVIRPFKGVEDLVAAFDSLSDEEAARFRLTIAGETWEDWTAPAEMIARSCHRDRITFINRYVTDDEVASLFRGADAVVLPYHRSSASGPLHMAMAHGLPVVVTAVGGLVEATAGYEGAILVPPRDPPAIRAAVHAARAMQGRHFADVHSWGRTVARYGDLFAAVCGGGRPDRLRRAAAGRAGRDRRRAPRGRLR